MTDREQLDLIAEERLAAIRSRGDANLRLPSRWNKEIELRPYQRVGAAHLIVKTRFTLGDAVGSGKTPQEIWAITATMEVDPNLRWLVVTTASAVRQWQREIQGKFAPGVKAFVLADRGQIKKRRKQAFASWLSAGPGSCLVMNWYHLREDMLEYMLPDLEQQHLVEHLSLTLDEAHRLANPGTRQWLSFAEFNRRVGRVHALTASLVKGMAHNAQGLIDAVAPGICSRQTFDALFCKWRVEEVYAGKYAKVLDGYKDLPKFRTMIGRVYLGRTDAEIGEARPEVTTIYRRLVMDSRHRKAYDLAEANLLSVLDAEGNEVIGADPAGAVIRAIQVCNAPEYALDPDPATAWRHPAAAEFKDSNAKLNSILELLETELAAEKVVIYCPHTTPLDHLAKALAEAKVVAVRITGQESQRQRDEAQAAFVSGSAQVILLTDAGGEALNLQVARHILFYARPWTPGGYVQVVGRIRRFGSIYNAITIWHLTCVDTIDDVVDGIVAEKFGPFDEIVRGRGELHPDSEVTPLAIARRLLYQRRNQTEDTYGERQVAV